MNYNIVIKTPTTAILSIESSELIDPNRKPVIRRFYPTKQSSAAFSTGAVLGREAGKSCALVVHIRAHDLICVEQRLLGTEENHWGYFRITSDVHPVALDLPNRFFSQQECLSLMVITDTEELDQIDFSDEGIQSYLALDHPTWLKLIVDRQISHWKKNKPDKFFRLAPLEETGQDIHRCVETSPYAALARFQDHLDGAQLSQCIAKCPEAAVRFALDRVPEPERQRIIVDHAREALLFSADRLSESELALCAKSDLFTAFRTRKSLMPRRNAILLSHSYLIANSASIGGSWIDLHDEIRDSILEFPDQWRASDPFGFPSIFSGLASYLETGLDPSIVATLLQITAPKDQQAIADFVASQV